jgi:hypothetical protein
MNTETQAVQSDPSDEVFPPTDAGLQPTARRLPYKSVLAVLVIGVITVGSQGLLVVGEEEAPANETLEPFPGTQVEPEAMSGEMAHVHTDQDIASIDQTLASLSDQIDRRFETLQAIVVEGRRTLSVLAEQIQTMGVTIADLGKNNQNLSQRMSETTQRLDTLAKSVQTLTVAKRTPIARKQSASATQPPFQIDAIDQWDDQTYVVVSQAGRVAFLKAGEQQSGWTLTHIDHQTGQVEFTGPAGTAYSVSVAR